MKIVWERESVTTRDVYEALLERRKVAYTTVMTMMKILEQKHYLRKKQADRAYVYQPAQPKPNLLYPFKSAVLYPFFIRCPDSVKGRVQRIASPA